MYRWPVYVCWSVIIALISILLETAADTCNAQREASLSVNELHLTLWPTKVQNPLKGIKVTSFYSLFSPLFPRTEHSRSLLKQDLYDWSSSICLKYYYCQSLLISLCKANLSINCIRCSCVFHAMTPLWKCMVPLRIKGRHLYSHILYFFIFRDSLHNSLPTSGEFCCLCDIITTLP